MSIEQTVLSNILINESYARKVVPFIKEEYFQNVSERTILRKINEYMDCLLYTSPSPRD